MPCQPLSWLSPVYILFPKYTPDEENEAEQRGRHKANAWWCVDDNIVLSQTTQ
jgi:hypothetical protein